MFPDECKGGRNAERKRVRLSLFAALAVALTCLWGTTIGTTGRWFGDHIAVTWGCGKLGIHWGGDAESRSFSLFNTGEWPMPREYRRQSWVEPMDADLFAIGGPTEALESVCWHMDAADWSGAFGIGIPAVSGLGGTQLDAQSVSAPIGTAVIASWALLVWGRMRRGHRAGQCERCGYPTDASRTSICPECGSECTNNGASPLQS